MKARPTHDRRWRYSASTPTHDRIRGRAPTKAEARTALIDAIASMLEAMAKIARRKP